jgi:DNA-binding phage protein
MNDMAKKMTNDDRPKNLSADRAIAALLAEAFKTEDAGYIAHAQGGVSPRHGHDANIKGRGHGHFARATSSLIQS